MTDTQMRQDVAADLRAPALGGIDGTPADAPDALRDKDLGQRMQAAARVTSAISALQQIAILADLDAMARAQGAASGRNPMALALVGVGLAWPVLGKAPVVPEPKADLAAANGGMQSPAKLAEDAWFDDGGKVSLPPKPPALGVTGALAAALGNILLHSRIKDETLGATIDRLLAEALRAFCEERDKLLVEDLRDEPMNEPMNDA